MPEMSLAPMAVALGEVLGQRVRFAEDCVGVPARAGGRPHGARATCWCWRTPAFTPRRRRTIPAFAAAMAKLADIYVNDAFSAAHRAHASTEGVAHLLPAYAGRLMQAELEALDAALGNPDAPGRGDRRRCEGLDQARAARATWSTKVNVLVIGGAMANTFLAAQGHAVGRSLQEAEMHATAREILARAKTAGCEVVLPTDAVVATELKPGVATQTVASGRCRPTR